jgi:hypothetical protein
MPYCSKLVFSRSMVSGCGLYARVFVSTRFIVASPTLLASARSVKPAQKRTRSPYLFASYHDTCGIIIGLLIR